MKAAASRGRPSVAPVPDFRATPFDLLAACGREQLTVAMDMSSALLRGAEAMRAVQQRAAQDAAARHRDAARDLRAPSGPADVLTVPFALLHAELAAAHRYWQDLAAAALEAQTEMLGCACSDTLDTETALAAAAAVDVLDARSGAITPQRSPARRRSRRPS